MTVNIKFESNQGYQEEAITSVTQLFAGVDQGSLGQAIVIGDQIEKDTSELFQDVIYGNQ
jgi:hypothetical protein